VSWLAPWALVVGAVGVVAAVVAHLLARATPEPMAFPTARFIPMSSASATRAARRPTDLLLLALRILAIVMIASAFAGPIIEPRIRGNALVVIVDRRSTVADSAEVRDSLASRAAERDHPVRLVDMASGITPALIAARREAARLSAEADSAELVIVAAFDSSMLDEATARVRREWPGAARLIPVTSRAPAEARGMTIDASSLDGDDPLTATIRLAGWAGPALPAGIGAPVRIARASALSSADSVLAAGGIALVHWPATTPEEARSAMPRSVVAGGLVVPLLAESAPVAPGERVVARWEDGATAASMKGLGEGCVVDVGIRPVMSGDTPLREDFRELLGVFANACLPQVASGALDSTALAMLAGSGGAADLVAMRTAGPATERISAWLLIAAIAALLLEIVARRRLAP
jgi:hypothetical protein